MVEADEEQVVEDGADVGRPVQEELEEDLGHEEGAGLDAEVHGEELVVVVEQQQHLPCVAVDVPMEKTASPSRMFFMPFSRNLRSNVVGSVRPLFSMLLKKRWIRSKALITATWSLELVFLNRIRMKGFSSF